MSHKATDGYGLFIFFYYVTFICVYICVCVACACFLFFLFNFVLRFCLLIILARRGFVRRKMENVPSFIMQFSYNADEAETFTLEGRREGSNTSVSCTMQTEFAKIPKKNDSIKSMRLRIDQITHIQIRHSIF